MAVSCGAVFEIKRDIGPKNANFSYPILFDLHSHLQNPYEFFSKILMQTVWVPGLLDGAEIFTKSWTL